MTGRTEARVREIRSRTRQYRRRYENRQLSCLTTCSLLLVAAIGALFTRAQPPGIAAVVDGYGAVLLRGGASKYVIVGIAAFILGVSVTVLCIRLKSKSTAKRESIPQRDARSGTLTE